MKIRYITKPQALNIDCGEGSNRTDGLKIVLKKLMGLNISLKQVAYVDDMSISSEAFSREGTFLIMAPANAEESQKKLVSAMEGFVSAKRSTEAVAEFLTKVYPKEYLTFHHRIHSVWFDMDGCVWEEGRIAQNQPFYRIITDYIKNCKGPYTAYPPISLCTEAYRKNVLWALDDIQLNKESIPEEFHRSDLPLAWPPIVFEGGCLAFDPITEKTFDLTEERYGLVSPVYRKLITIIMGLGKKIDERVPEIDEKLGAKCKLAPKERQGYCLDLPLELRHNPDDLKRAHTVIYSHIKDLFEELSREGIEIEFGGIFTKNELEEENDL